MKAITLAYDAAGKASLLYGPELTPQAQKAARLAAREKGLPGGAVRLETYSLGAESRLGVTVAGKTDPVVTTPKARGK